MFHGITWQRTVDVRTTLIRLQDIVFLDLENQGEHNSCLDQYINFRQLFKYSFAVTLMWTNCFIITLLINTVIFNISKMFNILWKQYKEQPYLHPPSVWTSLKTDVILELILSICFYFNSSEWILYIVICLPDVNSEYSIFSLSCFHQRKGDFFLKCDIFFY